MTAGKSKRTGSLAVHVYVESKEIVASTLNFYEDNKQGFSNWLGISETDRATQLQ